jgi:hypothetical protein
MSRGRQYSRSLIHGMDDAEAQIRADLSSGVRTLTREEIAELEVSLTPPKEQAGDYRERAYV